MKSTPRSRPGARALGGGERDLAADAGRRPVPHGSAGSAARAERDVARGAGAGRLA